MSDRRSDPLEAEEELSLSAIDGRIRRRKRRLERMNPVVDYAAYERRLRELVRLEALRREVLRGGDEDA